MSGDPIPWTDLLDARSPAGEPIAGAVAIPWPELASRRSELPARGSTLRLIGPPEAVDVLADLGLHASPATEGSHPGGRRLFAVDPLLLRFSPQPPGDALDLGCGAGREATWLAAAAWRVTAVDRLAERTAEAARLGALYGAGVETRIARIEAVLAETPAADLILLLRCWDAAFASLLARATRPGGLLLIATFAAEDEWNVAAERTIADADLARLTAFDVLHDARSRRGERRVREVVLRRK